MHIRKKTCGHRRRLKTSVERHLPSGGSGSGAPLQHRPSGRGWCALLPKSNEARESPTVNRVSIIIINIIIIILIIIIITTILIIILKLIHITIVVIIIL